MKTRMNRKCMAATLGLLVLRPVCGAVDAQVSDADVAALAEAQTAFAAAAYSKVEKGDENFFFSPMSVFISLGMVYGGARGGTEKQLASVLRTDLGQDRYHPAFARLRGEVNASLKKSQVRLSVAKLIAPQDGLPLRDEFVALARQLYGSEVLPMDFRAAPRQVCGRLNAWIEQHTNGRMKNLLGEDAVSADTRLIVLNAIYFKAWWNRKFSVADTVPEPFWTGKGGSVPSPTMRCEEGLRYGESDTAQVLELPYVDGAVAMLVVLPRNRDGLEAIEKELDAPRILAWRSMLSPADRYTVEVHLPRFELDTDMNLSAILRALGATDLFSPDRADLSAISPQKPLFLSAALHKAGVIVNEEGTEAWAATGGFISMGAPLAPPPRKVFRADHPFLFFITEQTHGSVLFMGRVIRPGKQAGP